MADDTRDKTGPISPRQREILSLLAQGWTHKRIASYLRVHPTAVTIMINRSILPKLGLTRSSEAVALYGKVQGLIQAAQHLKAALVPHPIGEAEEHVNHVLEAMAEELKAMAKRLLP